MAYDENLASRVRARLQEYPDHREQRMFGGLCWMVDGHMAAGVIQGALLVRIDPADWEDLLTVPGTRPFEMGRQRMPRGWMLVDPDGLTDDAALAAWVQRGVDLVHTLPPT